MSKLTVIHKAIQDILDTLPNHSKRIYLLEDYEPEINSILIMFESYREERKCVYIDKNGAYIAGRGQGQGDKSKMYFHEFDQLHLSDEAQNYINTEVNKIKGALDTRIPSKDIKVGDICREFSSYGRDENYIYVGKCEMTYDYSASVYLHDRKKGEVKNKFNIYVNLYKHENYKLTKSYGEYKLDTGYMTADKIKLRFDKRISTITNKEVAKLREIFEREESGRSYNYKLALKWID